MRWVKRILAALAAIVAVPLLVLAALAVAIACNRGPAVEARRATAPLRGLPGLFHVHAEGSHDGFGTVAEAAAAAAEAGARFLVLTEHNALHPPAPTVIDGVLIVPAVEISAQAGHVVALGASEVPPKEERGAGVLQAIAARGGDAILAHPINRRRPWADPSPDGFVAFEALSLDSAFRTAQKEGWWRLALALAALVGDAPKTGAILMERPAEALARYDEIAARRDVALVCGVDAHGLPPYPASFGALRLHLTGIESWGADPVADAAAVRAAIREGRTFCSVPALGDASSFTFTVPAPAPTPTRVRASVDAPGTTVLLFRDGREVARGPGRVEAPATPGVWRAEVWVDNPGFPFRENALWIASSAGRVR